MAVSYTPTIPSASTNGRPIKLGNTATLLHTCTSGGNQMDEVWIWVVNTSSTVAWVQVEVDNNTDPDDVVVEELDIAPNEGLVLVLPGGRYNGGTTIEAKAETADVLTATVVVNRIDTAA